MPSLNLGRVSINPRGLYDNEAEYNWLDAVRHGNSLFLALHTMMGITPVDGADWMLLLDGDLAKYYADLAQSYAEQASVPAVDGVYNVVLTDRATQERYALIVDDGRIELLGVSDELEATNMRFIDRESGIAYELIVENGRLFTEEAV